MSLRVVSGAAGLLLAAVGVLAVAAPAHAHDVLLRTTPADGVAVRVAPSEVTLVFDKPVLALGTGVRVAGPDGDVQTGAPAIVDETVTQPVRGDAASGSYTVTWRVTSVDGHPVSGTFGYTVGAGATAARNSPSATPTASPTRPSDSAAVAVKPDGRTSYAEVGIAAAVGALLGAAYVLWNRSRRKRAERDAS